MKTWCLVVLWLALGLLPARVLGCRYNVRDVGFVDIELEPYRLYVMAPADAPAAIGMPPGEALAVELRDCNIECELIAPGAEAAHPVLEHVPRERGSSLPDAILVSPDGRVLQLPAAQANRPFPERLASVLRQVASSPKREELLSATTQKFAAVLLIEGELADANRRARAAVAGSIAALEVEMRSMPKAVAQPPALVVLEAVRFEQERVLLWSLGLETAGAAEPRAVVVYGRARWMGPLMKGEEISERNLTGLLSIIGADCECDLDVTWTLGTRLPVRWDEARRVQAAEALGFDPENPVVRLEVGRIVARSGVPRDRPARAQPVVLSSDPRPGAEGAAVGRELASESVRGVHGRPAARPGGLVANAAVGFRAWPFIGALAIGILGTGLVLLWRGRRG
ncbi:MAG TPA: hypothetical protein PKM73_02510 [Verrucomicrobiota bacterium]|nr:hypothetical protein [Verrucomicrobiota bacterium]HNU49785.1 hypothetical protein [Verrucomicrobiota bacterium]